MTIILLNSIVLSTYIGWCYGLLHRQVGVKNTMEKSI